MTGVIGSGTPDEVAEIIDDNPGLTTIVLQDVPGSMNDEANLEASRLVRKAGLATHVPADGSIASGGVDFFLAGAVRSWDPGAEFGVHSWATSGGTEGKDVPPSDPSTTFTSTTTPRWACPKSSTGSPSKQHQQTHST